MIRFLLYLCVVARLCCGQNVGPLLTNGWIPVKQSQLVKLPSHYEENQQQIAQYQEQPVEQVQETDPVQAQERLTVVENVKQPSAPETRPVEPQHHFVQIEENDSDEEETPLIVYPEGSYPNPTPREPQTPIRPPPPQRRPAPPRPQLRRPPQRRERYPPPRRTPINRPPPALARNAQAAPPPPPQHLQPRPQPNPQDYQNYQPNPQEYQNYPQENVQQGPPPHIQQGPPPNLQQGPPPNLQQGPPPSHVQQGPPPPHLQQGPPPGQGNVAPPNHPPNNGNYPPPRPPQRRPPPPPPPRRPSGGVLSSISSGISNIGQNIKCKAEDVATDIRLNDPVYMRQQMDCVIGRGECDETGKTIRRLAPEIIKGFCPHPCDECKKRQIKKVMSIMARQYPTEWGIMINKFAGRR